MSADIKLIDEGIVGSIDYTDSKNMIQQLTQYVDTQEQTAQIGEIVNNLLVLAEMGQEPINYQQFQYYSVFSP